MAAPQRLQNGSLSPSARPVDTFLQFDANSTPAAPTQLSKLPQVKRVTSFQGGGKRDVQGVNSFEELADALKPLSKLYDAGAEMYASDQYRRGQNEILRAAANVNRDTIAKGLAYAEDNRQLSRENPVAGVLMDEANPFRQAGRVNQASQFVATLTPRLFEAEWTKKGGDLSKLDPGDPAILQVKSRVTTRLADMFQLDEFSPGFQQYVLPQINRSSEWLSAQQLKGHTAYQKSVGVRQASAVMIGLLFDPRTGPDRWNAVRDQFGAQFGVTGEPDKMVQAAIMQTVGDLQAIQGDLKNPNRQQAAVALGRLKSMPSGVTDANGIDIPIGEFYQNEIRSETAEVSRDLKTIRDNNRDQVLDLAEDDLDNKVGGLDMDPSQLAPLYAQMRQDPRYKDLSDSELAELVTDRGKAAQDFKELSFDSRPADEFLAGAEYLIGSDWDEAKMGQKFQEMIAGAPQKAKQDLRRRWQQLRDRKRSEARGQIDSGVMNRNITKGALAITKKLFPPEKGIGMIQAAQLQGLPLLQYMMAQAPNEAETVLRASNEIQERIVDEILSQTAKNGAPLSPGEQSKIANDVTLKVLKDEDLLDSFRTTSTTTPGQPAPAPATSSPSSDKPTTSEPKPEPLSFYTPGQAVPQEALETGKPVYGQKATTALLLQAANGRPIPSNVKRAARASNMTTGEFLIKQAELLGMPIPPGMKEKVQKVARAEQGAAESFASAAPVASSPLAYASNALFNILTGTAPAVAATRPSPFAAAALGDPTPLNDFSGQVSSITYDTGQPGIDVFFEDKRFPAVLGGRVKEVGYQGGDDSGYGNFVVVESIDPATGAPVDILYSHLASASGLNPGQQISTGQIVGNQGGTGRVRSADGTIASIDFLAPAPAGSKSMTPYSNYEQLRRSIAQQLRN